MLRRFLLLLCPLISLSYLATTEAHAQSYEELVNRTQNSLNDYMQATASPAKDSAKAGDNVLQTATLSSPTQTTPTTTPALALPPKKTAIATALPSPTLTAAPSRKLNTQTASHPLISSFKINDSFKGIRRENGITVISYTFDFNRPLPKSSPSGERDFAPLDTAQRQVIQEVFDKDIAPHIAVRFERAATPESAYLQLLTADLSEYTDESGMKGAGGYGSYPNPMGARIVLEQDLCSVLKRDCLQLKRVARHEIGHILGLQHPWEANEAARNMQSVMSYSPHYNEYQPQDIASLQALYGTPTGATTIALNNTPASSQSASLNTSAQSKGLLELLNQVIQDNRAFY